MAHSDESIPASIRPRNMPRLLDDYRAEQEAWQAHVQALVRLQTEVLDAANRDAGDIVMTARADIRKILVKARSELLVLAAQVQAVSETSQPRTRAAGDGPARGQADDAEASELDDARDALLGRRLDMRSVLDEARPELQGLAEEARALRARLAPVQRTVDVQETAPSVAPHRAFSEQPDAQAPNSEPRAIHVPPPSARADTSPDREQVAHLPSSFVFERPFLASSPRRSNPVGRIAGIVVLAAVGVSLGSVVWVYRGSLVRHVTPLIPANQAARVPMVVRPGTAAVASVPATLPPAAPAKQEGLTLDLELMRDSWMRVQVDGRIVAERLFRAGERRHIVEADNVSIRVGDAGAVRASVNGGDPNTLGGDGQAVTRHFTVEAPAPRDAAGPRPTPAAASTGASETTAVTLPPPVAPSAPPASERAPDAVAPASAASDFSPKSDTPSHTSSSGAAVTRDFVTAGQRWFDAYHRDDLEGMAIMAAADLKITDYRALQDRLRRDLTNVRRTFGEVKVQGFGDVAVVTAVMTEVGDSSAGSQRVTSLTGQTWQRQAGLWQLREVRITNRYATPIAGPGR